MKYYILSAEQKDFLSESFLDILYTKWNSNFPSGKVANPKFKFIELKDNKFGLVEAVTTSEDILTLFNTFNELKKAEINEIINSVELRNILVTEYKNTIL